MLKKILIGVAVAMAAFVTFVVTRPAQFHIERSMTMRAEAKDAYDILSDFHQWGAWSPWDKLDPSMKRTYSGPPTGLGASYAWAGNKEVGEGEMTITAAQPNEKIVIKLEFKKPFAQTNTTTFSIAPQPEEKVSVTWAMDGANGFVGAAFGIFVNMDKLIGDDFDRGLGALKTLVEAKAEQRAIESQRRDEAASKAAAMPEAPATADKGDLTDPWKRPAAAKQR